jgi:ferredoxin
MRSDAEYTTVLALAAQALNDCEISRQTGVPRATVRGWRSGTQRTVRPFATEYDWDVLEEQEHVYSYLLGFYLGDGSISRHPRDVYRLRIAIDQRHPHIINECRDAVAAMMPRNRVDVVSSVGCVHVSACSKHWPDLFPQHGKGKKHERKIELYGWQQDAVARFPKQFIRGLIHSDGSRFMNRVTVGGKQYAYPRYTFSNTSPDIRALFTHSCDMLGIAWRQMNALNVSVARKEAVAALDAFVGPKR